MMLVSIASYVECLGEGARHIDDEPNVRTLLDMLLRPKGYEVMLADNVSIPNSR
jgi:hypothetical protein